MFREHPDILKLYPEHNWDLQCFLEYELNGCERVICDCMKMAVETLEGPTRSLELAQSDRDFAEDLLLWGVYALESLLPDSYLRAEHVCHYYVSGFSD